MFFNDQGLHFFIRDFLPLLVSLLDANGSDLKSSRCGSRSDAVEEHLKGGQRRACPRLGDLTEEAMFHRVPLGCPRGIVAHGDRQVEGVHQLGLKALFPSSGTTPVGASSIGQNQ